MMRFILPGFLFALVAVAPALASEPVPVPAFRSLDLRGGGKVVVVPGPAQRVTILEGSSRFTRIHLDHDGALAIDACTADCPHHYALRIEVQSPSVIPLAVEGGGAISVAPGFAPQHDLVAAVNGGGRIDSRALAAREVTAAVSGGGELLVRAESSLTGAVQGGGWVRYWGNPKVTSEIEGGGSIRPGY